MFIINWLETAVSWVLVQFHSLLSPLFGAASGTTWVLSIVGLVIVIRILLIPLFVKQINATRNMQAVAPQMKEIQKKYAGDRERMNQEMVKLYRETGTNPAASCLPLLLQAPIFYALFKVLQGIAMLQPKGVMTPELTQQAHDATVWDVPIYGTFLRAVETPFPIHTRILTLVLIVAMTATTFISQRMMILKNSAPDNPMVKQQKMLLWFFPVIMLVSGLGFPVGVLFYWLTTNLWSMGQQFWVIRNNPQPGTPAEAAKKAREAAKAAKKAGGVAAVAAVAEAEQPRATRQQPKRQSKAQRKGAAPGSEAAAASANGVSGAASAVSTSTEQVESETSTSAKPGSSTAESGRQKASSGASSGSAPSKNARRKKGKKK